MARVRRGPALSSEKIAQRTRGLAHGLENLNQNSNLEGTIVQPRGIIASFCAKAIPMCTHQIRQRTNRLINESVCEPTLASNLRNKFIDCCTLPESTLTATRSAAPAEGGALPVDVGGSTAVFQLFSQFRRVEYHWGPFRWFDTSCALAVGGGELFYTLPFLLPLLNGWRSTSCGRGGGGGRAMRRNVVAGTWHLHLPGLVRNTPMVSMRRSRSGAPMT